MATERESRIRNRAYEIWEDEGRPEGLHDAHWHRAETEVADRREDPADHADDPVRDAAAAAPAAPADAPTDPLTGESAPAAKDPTRVSAPRRGKPRAA